MQSWSTGLASAKNALRPRVKIDRSGIDVLVSWAGEERLQLVESNTEQTTGAVARQLAASDPAAYGCGLNTCDLGSPGRRHEDLLNCSWVVWRWHLTGSFFPKQPSQIFQNRRSELLNDRSNEIPHRSVETHDASSCADRAVRRAPGGLPRAIAQVAEPNWSPLARCI